MLLYRYFEREELSVCVCVEEVREEKGAQL